MARKDKHGGTTWVAVKDRDEYKVRCRACSSVMFPREWWSHKCQALEDAGEQSNLSSTNRQSSEQENGDGE